jgi:conjugal transfer pilus assembly protein TraL
MAVSTSFRVYQHLDDPEIIGVWTFDEFFAAILPLFIGLLLRHPLIGLVFGVAAWWALRKLKAGKSLWWLYGILYWYLSPMFPLWKGVPPSNFKILVG